MKKNTKEIIAVTRVYICDKIHVDFHKNLPRFSQTDLQKSCIHSYA